MLLTSYNKKDFFLSNTSYRTNFSNTFLYQQKCFYRIDLTSYKTSPQFLLINLQLNEAGWRPWHLSDSTCSQRFLGICEQASFNNSTHMWWKTHYPFFERRQSLQGFWTFILLLLEAATPISSFLPSFLVGKLWLLPRWISGTTVERFFAWTTEIESIQFIQIYWICLFTLLSCCQSFGPNDRRWILQGRST